MVEPPGPIAGHLVEESPSRSARDLGESDREREGAFLEPLLGSARVSAMASE